MKPLGASPPLITATKPGVVVVIRTSLRRDPLAGIEHEPDAGLAGGWTRRSSARSSRRSSRCRRWRRARSASFSPPVPNGSYAVVAISATGPLPVVAPLPPPRRVCPCEEEVAADDRADRQQREDRAPSAARARPGGAAGDRRRRSDHLRPVAPVPELARGTPRAPHRTQPSSASGRRAPSPSPAASPRRPAEERRGARRGPTAAAR